VEDRPPVVEPHQSLSAAELLGVMGMVQHAQQPAPFPRTVLESRQAVPPLARGHCKARSRYERTFVHLLRGEGPSALPGRDTWGSGFVALRRVRCVAL
jgi:hypothetical protein